MLHPPPALFRHWTTWDALGWGALNEAGCQWIGECADWVVEQDGKGRSVLMAALEDQAPARGVETLFLGAIHQPGWKRCQALEDRRGVRLPAYLLRYATKDRFARATWIEAALAGAEPISSSGRGLLAQLSVLAAASPDPHAWVLGLVWPFSVLRGFSEEQWQAGLQQEQVEAWFSHRLFRSDPARRGSLFGPASMDLHLFYNLLGQVSAPHPPALGGGGWRHGLGEALVLLHAVVKSGEIDSRAGEQKRAMWQTMEPAIATLDHCLPTDNVVRDMLDVRGEAGVFDDLRAKVQSVRCAQTLAACTPQGEYGEAGRRL